MTIRYSNCSPSQQRLVNKFYKQHKTNVSCNLKDEVFCAVDKDDTVIAALMIRPIATTSDHLLRSLYVAPEHRGKGIAKALCRLAIKTHKKACYTLCEEPLVNFYLTLGFTASEQALDSQTINKQIKKGLRLLRRP